MPGNLGSLGSLFIDVAANTATFESDIGRAQRLADRAAKDMQARITAATQAIGVGLGAIGAASVVAFAKLNDVANSIADYKGLSEQIGDTAQAVASLKPVADVSGVALGTVAGASVKLTAALSKQTEDSAGAAAAIKALGLDFQTFQKTSPVAQMEALAKQFALFEDNAGKTAAAVALFGKSGAELIPFLNDLADRGERQVLVTEEQIKQADEYVKRLDRLKGEVGTLAQQYTATLIPVLDGVIGAFADVTREFTKNIDLRDELVDTARGVALGFATVAESIGGVARALAAVAGSAQVVLYDLGAVAKFPGLLASDEKKNDYAKFLDERSAAVNAAGDRYARLISDKGTAISDALRASFLKQDMARYGVKPFDPVRDALGVPEPFSLVVGGKGSGRPTIPFKAPAAAGGDGAGRTARSVARLGPQQDQQVKDYLRGVEEQARMMEAARRDRERLAESLSRQYGPASVGGVSGENARFAAELDAFTESREAIIARGDDYYALLAEAATAHQQELTRIEQAGIDARTILMQSQLNVASTVFGGIADLASVFGGKAFKAYKAFAIAEAITSTISGAIGAFSQASKTFPPPFGQALGAAAAAGVTASGLAQVARIRSTNIGSRRFGGAVAAGGVYEVAEPGNPELIKYGSKTILAMGSQPGTVMPAKDAMMASARGGSGGVSIVVNNTVGDLVAARARRSRGLNGDEVIELMVAELDDNASPVARRVQGRTGRRAQGAIG